MIGGNPNDFVDRIYSCQNTVFIYKGIKYWFQGYIEENGSYYMEVFQCEPSSERYVWDHHDNSLEACLQAFLDARFWNGKTFWEVEQDIEWVDY